MSARQSQIAAQLPAALAPGHDILGSGLIGLFNHTHYLPLALSASFLNRPFVGAEPERRRVVGAVAAGGDAQRQIDRKADWEKHLH